MSNGHSYKTGGDPMGTLTEQLAELCQDHHYPHLFLQGVAMGNDCNH